MMFIRRRRLKNIVTFLSFIVCIMILNAIIQKHTASPRQLKRWAEFLPNETPALMILAYQRTGSSFLGEMMNQNPKALYMFEPLDGMYSAMYGTPSGWSVPSDITHYKNGSIRVIPDDEIKEASRVLKSILSCDFKTIPPEIMLHGFIWQFGQKKLKAYRICVKRKVNGTKCKRLIPKICHIRFGGKPENLDYCKRMIAISRGKSNSSEVPPPPEFERYMNCYKEKDVALQPCKSVLRDMCLRSSTRSVKTVRASMAMAEVLLRELPNFRLVHLIRDPRSVVLSRQRNPTYHAIRASGFNEAHVYCADVVRDIRLRKRLEKQYPGKILQIVYEDFVNKPQEGLAQLYDFLNITVDEQVSAFIDKTRTDTLQKWFKKLTLDDVQEVNENCQDLYAEIKTHWKEMSL